MACLKIFPSAGFDPETHTELEVKLGAIHICVRDHVFARSWAINHLLWPHDLQQVLE